MFAVKSGSRAGRYARSIVVLLVVPMLLAGVAYASLPQLLSALVRHALATQGFAETTVDVSYPRWGEVRLVAVRARGHALGHIVELELDNIDVTYALRDLLAARVGNVRIASARAQLMPASSAPTGAETARPLSVVALLPGQWLLWLPARQVLLESAQIEWQRAADDAYAVQFSGHARHDEARLDGTIRLPELAQPLYFLGLASASGAIELTAWPQVRSEPALQLTAVLASATSDRVELSGTASARLDALLPFVLPEPSIATPVDGVTGGLNAEWQALLPVQPSADLQTLLRDSELNGSATLQARARQFGDVLQKPEVDLNARVVLDSGAAIWRVAKGSRLAAGLGSTAVVGLAQLDVRLARDVSVRLDFPQGRPKLTVERDARLDVQPVAAYGVAVPASTLTLAEAFELASSGDGGWRHGPLRLAIEASPVSWREYQVTTRGITLRLDPRDRAGEPMSARGTLSVDDLSARIGAHTLKPAQLHAQFESDAEQFSTHTRLSAAQGAAIINATMTHRFADGGGTARAVLEPTRWGASGMTLKHLVERVPYPLELNDGKLQANATLSWRRQGSQELAVYDDHLSAHLQDLAGSYDDVTFSGVSADVRLGQWDAPRTTEPAKFRARTVNVGVLVENVQATGRLDTEVGSGQPVVTLTQVGAELLGGTARSERIEWSPARERTSFGVRLEHLELAEIVKLQQQEGLEASGLLDGYLPIELTSAGLALKRGAIAARSPGGVIRYRPTVSVAQMAKTNPSVALVLGALNDFRYDSLDVNANATPEGDLTLQLQLKGANPSWQSGRPVHLNLNVEENMPDLLRSLRLAGEVADELGKRVQERYQQKP